LVETTILTDADSVMSNFYVLFDMMIEDGDISETKYIVISPFPLAGLNLCAV
jgi:hypothetical protein